MTKRQTPNLWVSKPSAVCIAHEEELTPQIIKILPDITQFTKQIFQKLVIPQLVVHKNQLLDYILTQMNPVYILKS